MDTSKNVYSGQGRGTSQNIQACTRCGGLLTREGLFDLLDDTGHMRRCAWRCVQCGDIVDSLILKHRMGQDLPDLNVTSRRRWTGVTTLIRRSMR